MRGLWLGYIALLAYLFIAAGAVTHRDLLLENPVKLPVLNVELPLVGFFAVAPVFFLINHFYLLLQLWGLGRRIGEFNDALSGAGLGEDAERRERRKLDTFVVVQMLAGTAEERRRLTGLFLWTIALITLVIAPVALLLFIQLQFLPYQNERVTWLHRGVLGADLVLLWMFWPSIRQGRWAFWPPLATPAAGRWLGTLARAAAAAVVMAFACVIATFPGEYADTVVITADGGIERGDWNGFGDSHLSSIKKSLFGGAQVANSGRIHRPATGYPDFFSRTLVLADDRGLIDQIKLDRIRERHASNRARLNPWETDRTLSLRERKLRGALFDRADLRNVDFFNADLRGAMLGFTDLQGASLNSARLQRASLHRADLQGASLNLADLSGARLAFANLEGASLGGADFRDAKLTEVNFRNASFSVEHARRAVAEHRDPSHQVSNPEAAKLFRKGRSVNFLGATLARANFQGVALDGAEASRASFNGANLQGASLRGAQLSGVTFDGAELQGASLDGARLIGASFKDADLRGASLDDADIAGAWLIGSRLRLASLNKTNVWHTSGEPDPVHLAPVWVKTPTWEAVDAEPVEIKPWEELIDRERMYFDRRLRARFEAMRDIGADRIPETFWNGLATEAAAPAFQASYRKQLAAFLSELVCGDKSRDSAPHFARGLIHPGIANDTGISRLEAVGDRYLPVLAKTFLDAAEGKSGDCPGAVGLDSASISRLRAWAERAD